MREYIAKTGGRYTYNDDLLNLQELAVSMTAIFAGCSNFIISGCEISGGKVTPGYVWINGRVRYFEGGNFSSSPYYIYERNSYETIAYAGDVNKHGRCNYLCAGGAVVPQTVDEVTGQLPSYIGITADYAPRFIDKFIGRYALLLDSPFAKQTVRKELVLAGVLTGEKDIKSKTALSVVNSDNGYELRNIVRAMGDASVGMYHNGLLINEIVINTNGTFTLYKQGMEVATFDENGVRADSVTVNTANAGSLCIQSNNIYNSVNSTDDGAVNINSIGYKGGKTKFRSLHVFDGKSSNPLLSVIGKDGTVGINAPTTIANDGYGIRLVNPAYSQNEVQLKNAIHWLDKQAAALAVAGFADSASLDFTVRNYIGNLILTSLGWVDIRGELRIGGINIADTYVARTDYQTDLSKKVDKVTGKQLSTEDFTTAYKQKLESILASDLSGGGSGFVTASDVAEALKAKLTISKNLSDIADRGVARTNLELYSKTESDSRYFRITNALSEAIALNASEIEGKTAEEIIQLKEQRQSAVRDNIAAEKKGTGEQKLAKAMNLSDVADKSKARQNIGVYSIAEIDAMLAGKLGSDEAYNGVPFTSELKNKLDAIRTGVFAGTVINGVSQSQVEGYVMTSAVAAQLDTRAPKLLTGYSAADKTAIAENIGVYSIGAADAKFAAVSQGFNDLVSHLVKQGNSAADSRKILRDNIAAAGTTDLDNYIRRDKKLGDLAISGDNDKKLACQAIGAAYAPEYQTKIADTGWLPCTGENAGTLFARQIGNVVCVQGTINTGKKSGNTWGSCATIPNAISPPKYGCRQTAADFDSETIYNRGCSFRIQAGSNVIQIYERGMNNVLTELHFTYMT